MELQTVVQEFLLAGQANGWSPATRRQYERHLAWLLAWLAEHGAVALSEVTRSLLREWLAAQRERWAPATCRVAVIALRSLLAFAEAEEYGGGHLVSAVRVPSVPERVQRAVDRHEVEALLRACEEPCHAGLTAGQAEAARLRNAAIVAVLFDSILRASELCGLDVADVYLPRLRLAVRREGREGAVGAVQRANGGVSARVARCARWLCSDGRDGSVRGDHREQAGRAADNQRATDRGAAPGRAGGGA